MQLQRPKIGNRAKGRQSAHNRAYYENYRRLYASKLIRRREKRLKGLEANKGKPKRKHPSDVRRAQRRLRLQH